METVRFQDYVPAGHGYIFKPGETYRQPRSRRIVMVSSTPLPETIETDVGQRKRLWDWYTLSWTYDPPFYLLQFIAYYAKIERMSVTNVIRHDLPNPEENSQNTKIIPPPSMLAGNIRNSSNRNEKLMVWMVGGIAGLDLKIYIYFDDSFQVYSEGKLIKSGDKLPHRVYNAVFVIMQHADAMPTESYKDSRSIRDGLYYGLVIAGKIKVSLGMLDRPGIPSPIIDAVFVITQFMQHRTLMSFWISGGFAPIFRELVIYTDGMYEVYRSHRIVRGPDEAPADVFKAATFLAKNDNIHITKAKVHIPDHVRYGMTIRDKDIQLYYLDRSVPWTIRGSVDTLKKFLEDQLASIGKTVIGAKIRPKQRRRVDRPGPRRQSPPLEDIQDVVHFVSFWVYSHNGVLDRESSRFDVKFTLEHLLARSILKVFTQTVFATRGAVEHFNVYACFRKELEEEGSPPDIHSEEDFHLFAGLSHEDLERQSASTWAGVSPEDVPFSLVRAGKVAPFGDKLCGYILQSTGPLWKFPLTLRFNLPKDKWLGIGPTDMIAQTVKDELVETVKMSDPVFTDISVSGLFTNAINDVDEMMRRIPRFEANDSLRQVYAALFFPSTEGRHDWFEPDEKKPYYEAIKNLGFFADPIGDRKPQDVNRAILDAAVYHTRLAKKRGIEPTIRWYFNAYAPYVVQADLSMYARDLPEDLRQRELEFGHWQTSLSAMDLSLFLIPENNPEWASAHSEALRNPTFMKRVRMLGQPRKFEYDPDMKRGAHYVIWRPVHITGASMEAFIASHQVTKLRGSSSPLLADIISNFKTPGPLQSLFDLEFDANENEWEIHRRETPDIDRVILWSNTDHVDHPLVREGEALIDIPESKENVGYVTLRTFEEVENIGDIYKVTSPHPDPSIVQGDLLEDRKRYFQPYLMLSVDFSDENVEEPYVARYPYPVRAALHGWASIMTDDYEAADVDDLPYAKHSTEMDFAEFVRLQEDYDRVVSSSPSGTYTNLMYSEGIAGSGFSYNERAADNFELAWKNGTAKNLRYPETQTLAFL